MNINRAWIIISINSKDNHCYYWLYVICFKFHFFPKTRVLDRVSGGVSGPGMRAFFFGRSWLISESLRLLLELGASAWDEQGTGSSSVFPSSKSSSNSLSISLRLKLALSLFSWSWTSSSSWARICSSVSSSSSSSKTSSSWSPVQ